MAIASILRGKGSDVAAVEPDSTIAEVVARLVQRDGSSPDMAARMVAAQASRSARLAIADDVIVNDGSLAQLEAAVRSLHARYLALAAGRG